MTGSLGGVNLSYIEVKPFVQTTLEKYNWSVLSLYFNKFITLNPFNRHSQSQEVKKLLKKGLEKN